MFRTRVKNSKSVEDYIYVLFSCMNSTTYLSTTRARYGNTKQKKKNVVVHATSLIQNTNLLMTLSKLFYCSANAEL